MSSGLPNRPSRIPSIKVVAERAGEIPIASGHASVVSEGRNNAHAVSSDLAGVTDATAIGSLAT
jgi:hypothetical protein